MQNLFQGFRGYLNVIKRFTSLVKNFPSETDVFDFSPPTFQEYRHIEHPILCRTCQDTQTTRRSRELSQS